VPTESIHGGHHKLVLVLVAGAVAEQMLERHPLMTRLTCMEKD
jgi:hypothetical protein